MYKFMEKGKKIKLYLGLFYLILVSTLLFFFSSKFNLSEITSYDFIKNNRDYFFKFKETNLFLLVTVFILFTIIWVLAAGFVSPLAIFAGFIFGKWIALIVVIFGMSVGATALYVFANYFLQELIKDKFLNKFKNLEIKFKKSEFIYLLFYRFIGGIPFVLSNVLPCIFNVKSSNFFWATLIGVTPQIFLLVSIGSGFEKIVSENSSLPSVSTIILTPEIYWPLILFFILVILCIVLKKFFYKK